MENSGAREPISVANSVDLLRKRRVMLEDVIVSRGKTKIDKVVRRRELPCIRRLRVLYREWVVRDVVSMSMERKKPVPFEALLPFGIITGFFMATASGLRAVKYYANDKHPHRFGLDNWDLQMMERDKRLTGSLRGQSVCSSRKESKVTD
ncbi:hypothetical protein [Absidia glauca]|uniref:NADH dehydrogenase [ubiquinone] 1 alpha subcomplex subunit 1 n=1 Tax=Absidia glauca TaxID=4829 RepID=A0A163KTC1_ABSGL|nr:hypothetical protein [Absidia glauca]